MWCRRFIDDSCGYNPAPCLTSWMSLCPFNAMLRPCSCTVNHSDVTFYSNVDDSRFPSKVREHRVYIAGKEFVKREFTAKYTLRDTQLFCVF